MTTLRDATLNLIGSNLYITGTDPNRGFQVRCQSASTLHLEAEDAAGAFTQAITIDGENYYIGLFNSSPGYPLELNGDAYFNNSLTVVGSLIASGASLTAGTVPLSALQNIATDVLLGRSTAGTGPVQTITCTAAGRALLDDADASAQRTTLGLGTIATQAANNVTISGGSITGITDLAVADGGTGASTAANARTNLGLGTIATQNSNSVTITGGSITGITDLAVADGGTGASDAATARTNLGLGSIATQASSNVTITGGSITGITDLAVADGGTGASTAAAARTNLGLGTMAVQNDSAVSLTGMATSTSQWRITNDDTRLLLSGGSGSPTKAFTINYSAALDAQGNMTFQRRSTSDAFEAVVGGFLVSSTRWFFGATSFSGAALFDVDGNAAIRGDLTMYSAGNGFRIAEGSNATSGVATLVAGTVTVNTTKALTNSRIHLTSNSGGGTPGWLRVSARVNATSFTITSSSATDTSTVAWLIINQ